MVEPYLITLSSNSDIFPTFQHEGIEMLYMIEGEVDYRHGNNVFSLKPGDICWKGNFASNEAARTAVDAGPCREKLAPEKP